MVSQRLSARDLEIITTIPLSDAEAEGGEAGIWHWPTAEAFQVPAPLGESWGLLISE